MRYGTRRIPHLGVDVEFPSSELILDFRANEFSLGVFMELGDTTVVSDCRTQLDGGHNQRDVHACIIMLSWKTMSRLR